jgi:filamentous hemagglutinin family protein
MMTRPILAAVLLGAGAALANPTGPTVVAGSATLTPSGNTLTVTNSNGAVINWQGFSIGASETTRFQQPSSSSTVLNRVVGAGSSDIQGALTSNGKVFLVNPNGVLFGPGAQVNVAGLVATSLNITDANFLAGNYRFEKGATAGVVQNDGTIVTTPGGYVALLAPTVFSNGTISAPAGSVAIGGGDGIQLGFAGDTITGLDVFQAGAGGSVVLFGAISADRIFIEAGLITVEAGLLDSLPQIVLPTIPELGGASITGGGFTVGGGVTLASAGTAGFTGSASALGAIAPAAQGAITITGSSTQVAAPNTVITPAVTLNLRKREVTF